MIKMKIKKKLIKMMEKMKLKMKKKKKKNKVFWKILNLGIWELMTQLQEKL